MTASNDSVFSTAMSSRSEEAHWSSFRGEVVQLQSLLSSLFDDDNNDNHTSTTKRRSPDQKEMRRKAGGKVDLNARSSNQSAPREENDTDANDATLYYRNVIPKENKLPQSQLQLSPLEELDDSAELSDNDEQHYESTSLTGHHFLELTGMEEVDRSICSVNNKKTISSHHHDDLLTNNATSHASQNTNAHSIATQELAEMKLKLALTESERDELEFELMQSR